MTQGDPRADRPPPFRPAQVRERFKEAVILRARSVPDELQAAVEAEVQAAQAKRTTTQLLPDDLINLSILRRHALMYETRWLAHLTAVFDAWPQAPAAESSRYALLSEDELQSQLVGQPVIEALDRRFSEILDVIDSRLWDFSLRVSGNGESINPVGPRALVGGLLNVFPRSECSPALRAALLRHYQQQAGAQLGEFYAWFNTELAEAGFAMTRPGRYANEVASSVSARVDPRNAPPGNMAGSIAPPRAAQGGPGHLTQSLLERLREQRARGRAQTAPTTGRVLGLQEFLAVLSLTQADGHPAHPAAPPADLVASIRRVLVKGAANLGLDPALTVMSQEQDDAIDLVGSVLGALIDSHHFDDAATRAMADLAFPYVHLLLGEPALFDDNRHPATALLAQLCELWDGAPAEGPMHALGLRAARAVIADYHGEAPVFDRVLVELRDQLEPLRLRAQISGRRAWQTMAGRERLEAARRDADAALHGLLVQRRLLPTIAVFLADVWRQALVHAWLREGPQSGRYATVRAIGDSLLQVDQDAADGAGQLVAQRLLALEQSVRDCYVACGLNETAANEPIAALVAEIARPDAQRETGKVVPLAAADERCDDPPVAGGCRVAVLPGDTATNARADAQPSAAMPLRVDQTVIGRDPASPPQAWRLVGISELSGRHLLVNPHGAQLTLEATEVASRLLDGRLVARDPGDGVEATVRRLASDAALAMAD